MDEATDKASVAAFVKDVLAGTGWELDAVRRRSSKLDPPDWYWAQFDILINRDEEERRLRLVAKGALNPAAWTRLSERLMHLSAGQSCDPIDGVGYPCLFPETQHAYWFYPFDPEMPNLPAATDPVRMASVLLGPQAETTDVLAASRRLTIERVRHVPEVGAILRYTIEHAGGEARPLWKGPTGQPWLKDLSHRSKTVGGGEPVPRLLEPPAAAGIRRGVRSVARGEGARPGCGRKPKER